MMIGSSSSSLVTRSVKSKVVKKMYEVLGPRADGGRAPPAGWPATLVGLFLANNYKIKDATDVIIFEGMRYPLCICKKALRRR